MRFAESKIRVKQTQMEGPRDSNQKKFPEKFKVWFYSLRWVRNERKRTRVVHPRNQPHPMFPELAVLIQILVKLVNKLQVNRPVPDLTPLKCKSKKTQPHLASKGQSEVMLLYCVVLMAHCSLLNHICSIC